MVTSSHNFHNESINQYQYEYYDITKTRVGAGKSE